MNTDSNQGKYSRSSSSRLLGAWVQDPDSSQASFKQLIGLIGMSPAAIASTSILHFWPGMMNRKKEMAKIEAHRRIRIKVNWDWRDKAHIRRCWQTTTRRKRSFSARTHQVAANQTLFPLAHLAICYTNGDHREVGKRGSLNISHTWKRHWKSRTWPSRRSNKWIRNSRCWKEELTIWIIWPTDRKNYIRNSNKSKKCKWIKMKRTRSAGCWSRQFKPNWRIKTWQISNFNSRLFVFRMIRPGWMII